MRVFGCFFFIGLVLALTTSIANAREYHRYQQDFYSACYSDANFAYTIAGDRDDNSISLLGSMWPEGAGPRLKRRLELGRLQPEKNLEANEEDIDDSPANRRDWSERWNKVFGWVDRIYVGEWRNLTPDQIGDAVYNDCCRAEKITRRNKHSQVLELLTKEKKARQEEEGYPCR